MRTLRIQASFRKMGQYGFLLLLTTFSACVSAGEYYADYNLSPNAKRVVFGVQPLAYPLAFISSIMQRDRLLRNDLKKNGLVPQYFSFRKGPDIVAVTEKIDVSFLGDMPTVNTIVKSPSYVVGLGKRNFSSIVSRRFTRLEELKGKRIAYAEGTSSHLTLLRGMKAAKMSERDVQLVQMGPAQMPDALDSDAVDAFSAWEPTPSISLERSEKNRAIYRGMSTDWVVFSRKFAETQPEVALAVAASYVRAIHWMRASNKNLARAVHWVMLDGAEFTGKPPAISLAKAMEIVQKDLLEVPGAPAIPAKVDGAPPLMREFEFLKQQSFIDKSVEASKISEALTYTGIKQVAANPKKYRQYVYNYDE